MCSLATLQAEPKASDLPPGAEMQPGKLSMGGEELMSHWITFFVAGMWYLNQEREQCTELKEWGQGCWSEGKKKELWGVDVCKDHLCALP